MNFLSLIQNPISLLLRFATIAAVLPWTPQIHADPITIAPVVGGKGVVLGSGTYESGTELTLRAVPEVDWQFDHWSSVPAELTNDNPITLTAAIGLHPVANMIPAKGSGHFAGGPLISYNAPLPTNFPNVVQVSAAAGNATAVTTDGALYSLNAADAVVVEAQNQLGPVTTADAGPTFLIAIKTNTTVAVTGGGSVTNVPYGLSNVVSVAAGFYHAVALKNDGTVVAWGGNNFGQSSVPAGLRDVVAIAAGEALSLAVKSDGSAVVWGKIHTPAGDYLNPVLPASFTNLVSISSSYNYTLGLRADGSVVTWGFADLFGSGVTPSDLANIREVSAGWENGLAIDSSNILRAWGRPQLDPVIDPVPNVVTSDAGDEFFYGIQGPGFGLLRSSRTSMLIEENQPLLLAPSVVGGQGYQWFHNGHPIAGATSPILAIPSLQTTDAGTFQLVVTNETDAFATPATDVQILAAGYPRVVVNGIEIHGSNRVSQAQIALNTTLPNAIIFYTLDGSAPTINSTSYTGPINFSQPTNLTVRALALSGDFSQQATNDAVTINVSTAYTVSVTNLGPGTVTVTPNAPQFFAGDYVILQAVPNTNSVFLEWSKDLSGANPTQELVIDRSWTIQANFTNAPKYSATTIAPPGAVTVNPSGPQYLGTDVSITALPANGWIFEGWSGDHSGPETNFTWHVAGPAIFDANYDTTITTTSSGPGHIELDPDLPRYKYGSQVQVVPVPDFGNYLALWGLDGAGKPTTAWTLTVTNAQPKISALFQPSPTASYMISEPTLQNNDLTIHITGTVGTSFTVQLTTDFVTWNDDQTFTLQGNSSVDVNLAFDIGTTGRFYRIRQNQ